MAQIKPILCLSLALVAACAAPKNGVKAKPAEPQETPVYEYGIGAEDVLQIDVWKNPELSREVKVRPDGFVSLPLIQDVRAVGMTASELSQVLKQHYRDFVEDPEVSVTVKEANSYKIYVLGKITNSGVFQIRNPVTVLQAISMAGGFTPFADTNGVTVIRRQGGKDLRLPFHYDDVVKGKKTEENILLQPGDTVVVP